MIVCKQIEYHNYVLCLLFLSSLQCIGNVSLSSLNVSWHVFMWINAWILHSANQNRAIFKGFFVPIFRCELIPIQGYIWGWFRSYTNCVELTRYKNGWFWNCRAFYSPMQRGNFKTSQFFGSVVSFLYCFCSSINDFSWSNFDNHYLYSTIFVKIQR